MMIMPCCCSPWGQRMCTTLSLTRTSTIHFLVKALPLPPVQRLPPTLLEGRPRRGFAATDSVDKVMMTTTMMAITRWLQQMQTSTKTSWVNWLFFTWLTVERQSWTLLLRMTQNCQTWTKCRVVLVSLQPIPLIYQTLMSLIMIVMTSHPQPPVSHSASLCHHSSHCVFMSHHAASGEKARACSYKASKSTTQGGHEASQSQNCSVQAKERAGFFS